MTLPYPMKKPLPKTLCLNSGPTIQLFNLQKYFNISGPTNLLLFIYCSISKLFSKCQSLFTPVGGEMPPQGRL